MKRFLFIFLASCLAFPTAFAQSADLEGSEMKRSAHENEAVIYLAGGCFWGMEKLMSVIPGVIDATSGYANGTTENPTYRQVCGGDTGHRETVRVTYRPETVSLEALLSVYFSVIDPTQENQQGNDVGTQYRTGVFYADPSDEQTARAVADRERARYDQFFVEIGPLTCFYEAEPEHQDYLDVHPGGYCHIPPSAFERARNLLVDSADYRKPSDEALEALGDGADKPYARPITPAYHSVTPRQASEWMETGEPLIVVDVRSREEYAAGRIPGAILLPLDQIGAEPPEALPDLNAKILVYCRSGRRSLEAAQKLVAMGYTAVYDLGGILDWPYEIERDTVK